MQIVLLDTETTGINKEHDNILEIGVALYDPMEVTDLSDFKSIPKLTMLITRPTISGNVGAFSMNAEIIKEINDLCEQNNINSLYAEENVKVQIEYNEEENHYLFLVTPDKVVPVFLEFLGQHGFINFTNYAMREANNDYNSAVQNLIRQFDYDPSKIKFMLKSIYIGGKNVVSFDLPFLKNDIVYWDLIKIKYRQVDPSIIFTTYVDTDVPNLTECFVKLGVKQKTSHRAIQDALDVGYLLYFHFKHNRLQTALILDDEFTIQHMELFETDDEFKEIKQKYSDNIVISEKNLNILALKARINSFRNQWENTFDDLNSELIEIIIHNLEDLRKKIIRNKLESQQISEIEQFLSTIKGKVNEGSEKNE